MVIMYINLLLRICFLNKCSCPQYFINGVPPYVIMTSSRIIECQGLPLISGQNCDPYATVSLVGPAR